VTSCRRCAADPVPQENATTRTARFIQDLHERIIALTIGSQFKNRSSGSRLGEPVTKIMETGRDCTAAKSKWRPEGRIGLTDQGQGGPEAQSTYAPRFRGQDGANGRFAYCAYGPETTR